MNLRLKDQHFVSKEVILIIVHENSNDYLLLNKSYLKIA